MSSYKHKDAAAYHRIVARIVDRTGILVRHDVGLVARLYMLASSIDGLAKRPVGLVGDCHKHKVGAPLARELLSVNR